MKILIVSKCPTHPTDAGNRWWILSQAEMFISLGHEVHFLYINEMPLRRDRTPYLVGMKKTNEYWGDRFHFFKVSKWMKFKMVLTQYFRLYCNRYHWKIDDEYPKGLEKVVNDLDSNLHFDICIINYYYLSRLFEKINIPKKAIATHDVFAYKNLKIGMPTMCLTADAEAKAMQRCPHIFALQEQEADYFQILSPNSKVYNLYGKYEHHSQPIVGNHKILFFSGGNIFNQNGIKWFLNDIFPVVRQYVPDAELIIGGSICNILSSFDTIDGVKIFGSVDDPADFYKLADVAINPVYQGTGLKIKTFESISYDKVTMVHPHSLTGVFKKDSAPLFASDDPYEWAKYIKNIWSSSEIIHSVKIQNKKYLDEMSKFILSEYNRFLND